MSVVTKEKIYEVINGLPDDVSDHNQVNKHISIAIEDVCKKLNVGCMTVSIESPVHNPLTQGERLNFNLVESEAGYDEECAYRKKYVTPQKCVVTITSYPVRNTVFSDEEISDIDEISRLIFFYGTRSRAYRLLDKAINYDALTGVLNQHGMVMSVMKMSDKDAFKDYNAVFFNIRNFKYINSRVGSRRGDEALIAYANTIKTHLADHGMVCRLGGDNFFVLVKKEFAPDFISFLKQVTITVNTRYENVNFDVSARIGMYEIEDGDSFPSAINKASIAYSATRRSGADSFHVYRSEMMKRDTENKKVSMTFKKALDDENIVVYYQPKVNILTNEIVGAEALVRWKREGRVDSPSVFIPILEADGNVRELDIYVFEKVCQNIREQIDAGIEPVKVSVNFSRVHLFNEALTEKIIGIVERYNVPRRYIEIEITESAYYSDTESQDYFIKVMHEAGFTVAIDDFGTGLSSLSILTNGNIDVIKLDKSLVDNVASAEGKDAVLFKCIVRMIYSMGIDMIAEGVETKEQLEFLKTEKCNNVQGFLYDRPLEYRVFRGRLVNSRTYAV